MKISTKLLLFSAIIATASCSGSQGGDSAAIIQCASYKESHSEFMKWESNLENPYGKISVFGQKVTLVLDAIERTGAEIPSSILIQLKDDDYRQLAVGTQIDVNQAVDRLASDVALRHEFITGQCALINR
jgi:hypothetical protein